jgi:hypothetical protein
MEVINRKEKIKMNEEIVRTLDDGILSHLNKLNTMSVEDKEYSKVVEATTQLYKLRLEEAKLDIDSSKYEMEFAEKEAQRLLDESTKKAQLKEQVKDRYFKIIIGGVEVIVPIIFYGVWMKRGFKFEETGTFTSTTFRGLFGRFRTGK